MATKVVMAQLSPTMEEGKLIEWKVSEGDEVRQGDIVAEIETDKANMEVEAMGGGVLRKIVVEAGETVPVGALIGVIADPDESIDDLIADADVDGAGPSEDGTGTDAAVERQDEEDEEGEEKEEAGAARAEAEEEEGEGEGEEAEAAAAAEEEEEKEKVRKTTTNRAF